jgi:nitronate monooxygenase
MKLSTAFTARFGIAHPIVQAPMAGGPTTHELVAAVSNAGAMGSWAAALLPPDQIAAGVARIRALTDRPFAVNLFVLGKPRPRDAQIARALERMQPMRAELDLPPAPEVTLYGQPFEEQLQSLIDARPAVASFTFGILKPKQARELSRAGIRVIGTATTVAEAKAWEAIGAQAVCAQGAEAGAHRGTFLGDFEQSMIGTLALTPQVADAVAVPVIAAGGIMDGRGIAAALALGASAAQLGTAFLGCPEAGVAEPWRRALREAGDQSTLMTRAFSGRPARGIRNAFIERMRKHEKTLPAYPVQNALTTDLRRAAQAAGKADYMSLWAGQGVGLLRERPAAQLVAELIAETGAVLARLATPGTEPAAEQW